MLKKLSFFLLLSFALAGCKKNPDGTDPIVEKPSISTNPASDLTSSTVVCGGNITNNGPVNVLVSGLCWSTTANPNISANLHTTGSTIIGTFSDNLAGLTPKTTYYIRAYLTTLSDTIYGNQVAITTPEKHIYIAGFEINSSNRYIARYWKDGTAIVLTNGTQDAEASSIYAVGNDVYVAGYESNGTKKVAKLWKNGVATNLSNGTNDAAANAVLVNNNNLYVAGYESNGSKKVARLWKNGVAQNISNGNFDAAIAAIAVKNDKVYLTGYETDGTAGSRGKYWIDGVPTVVNSDNSEGFGSSIAISGTDVYVAGTISAGFANNHVMLWKNGQQVRIDQGNFFFGVGTGISIFGNDIHVCGSTNDSGASWWKNGSGISLTGNYNSRAKAIQVVGGIVYITGATITSSGYTLPAYWVDRVLVGLPYTALYSTTTSIFVQ